MSNPIVNCSYEDEFYNITLKGNQDLLNPLEIFFEDDDILINKENIVSYCLFTKKKKNEDAVRASSVEKIYKFTAEKKVLFK